MPKKRTDTLMHDVARRTAYDWTHLAEFKALVRKHRKEIEDRILGAHAVLAQAGVQKIADLLKNTANEVLAFSIAKDVRDTYRDMLNYSEIDRRLSALEQAGNEDNHTK